MRLERAVVGGAEVAQPTLHLAVRADHEPVDVVRRAVSAAVAGRAVRAPVRLAPRLRVVHAVRRRAARRHRQPVRRHDVVADARAQVQRVASVVVDRDLQHLRDLRPHHHADLHSGGRQRERVRAGVATVRRHDGGRRQLADHRHQLGRRQIVQAAQQTVLFLDHRSARLAASRALTLQWVAPRLLPHTCERIGKQILKKIPFSQPTTSTSTRYNSNVAGIVVYISRKHSANITYYLLCRHQCVHQSRFRSTLDFSFHVSSIVFPLSIDTRRLQTKCS